MFCFFTGVLVLAAPKVIEETVPAHLIEKGFVDFIGTDIHRTSHLPGLHKALKSDKLHELVNSGKLLNHTLTK